MKKILFGLLLGFMCLGLCGCCLKHEWAAADCIHGETCSKCGEEQGEALGHDWVEASCTAARHCERCGETEGEALSHEWVEADFWTPRCCSVCGEEDGDVLTPEFVEHGLEVIEVDLSKDVLWEASNSYITGCYEDCSKSTVGELEIAIYAPQSISFFDEAGEETAFGADELIAAMGIEPLEGYKLVSVSMSILFSDENAWKHGVSVGSCFEDYYTIVNHDESSVWSEEPVLIGNKEFSLDTYKINLYGEEAPAYCITASYFGPWSDQTVTWYNERYYYIPADYDGTVVGLYHKTVDWPDGAYIYDVADENALFYRIIP